MLCMASLTPLVRFLAISFFFPLSLFCSFVSTVCFLMGLRGGSTFEGGLSVPGFKMSKTEFAPRLCLRKIPMSVTEEEFLTIPCIARAIRDGGARVDFYSAELVGETSAVPSSTALVTFKNEKELDQFRPEFERIEFNTQPIYRPQVEYAPIRTIPQTTTHMQRSLPSIDEEQEFMEFKAKLEETTTPIDVNGDLHFDEKKTRMSDYVFDTIQSRVSSKYNSSRPNKKKGRK